MDSTSRDVIPPVFRQIVEQQLAVRPGEEVLVIADADTETKKIDILCRLIDESGAIYSVVIQPNSGFDPTDPHAITGVAKAAFMVADVVICAGMSSSATILGRPPGFWERLADKKKVRMFGIVGRTYESLVSDDTDYEELAKLHERLKRLLSQSQELRIRTELGTDFRGGCQGVPYERFWPFLSHEGFASEPGTYGGRPDGLVHWPCPLESMEGELVVDGMVQNICDVPDEPIRMSVMAGHILKIEGGSDARELARFLETVGQHTVSKIGFGTNPNCVGGATKHLATKGLGNVHATYGGWKEFQPSIPHKTYGDLVMYNGTVEVDGKSIIADGRLLI